MKLSRILPVLSAVILLVGCFPPPTYSPAPTYRPRPAVVAVQPAPQPFQPAPVKVVGAQGPHGGKAALVSGPKHNVLAVKKPSGKLGIIALPKIKPREVRPMKPKGGKYTWVGGHWNHVGGKYVWQRGRWERNRPGKRWVAGKYTVRGNVHVWAPGHWQ